MNLRGVFGLGFCVALSAVAAGACSSSSSDNKVDGIFTQAEWTKVKELSPLPPLPPDTTNKYADNPQAATFGQRLFWDKAFSGPIVTGADATNGGNGAVGEKGKVACASCHQPENHWIDRRSNPNKTSLGTNWTPRNAHTILNAAYYTPFNETDGLRDSPWSDACSTDPFDPNSFNGNRLLLVHTMFRKYRADYDALFDVKLDPALDPTAADAKRFPAEGNPKSADTDPDGDWEKMTDGDRLIANTIIANYGKAIQAYLRLLLSKDAPFDKYVAGDKSAISASAKNGLSLFIGKAACVACHSGPAFTDNKFHNQGLVAEGEHIIVDETGRYDGVKALLATEFNSNGVFSDDKNTGRLNGVVVNEGDRGKWRTKELREIAETAPYEHTGQFANLIDVVHFVNQGGGASTIGTKDPLMKPLNLTEPEMNDIVEFLKTLTGTGVSQALSTDTSAPN
jgi:cytochrome c peroxidase